MWSRAIDFALYALIGLGVGVCVLWFADQGVPREAFAKWAGLSLFSTILLGTLIVNHRDVLTQPSFWLHVVGLFAAHVLAFVLILTNVDDWKIIWFGLIYPVELVGIEAALSRLGYHIKRR